MSPARSLRLRLVLIVAALLAAVAAIIGLVSVAVLQSYLVGQVDDSVSAAAERASRGPGGPDGPGGGFVLGQGEGTVIAFVQNGEVVEAGYLDEYGDTNPLSEAAQEEILGLVADGRPHTVELGADLGEYRMVAVVNESRTLALVTGLPLAGVQDTVRQLGLVVLIVTVVGLLLACAAAWVTVGAALRPLRRVAQTAASVAELPLDRDADISIRVPEKDTDPSTEVGRVGAALNRLLGHVGTALAVRKASEDRMRQFVGDASHELRTPLASIRGYSELTRRTQPDLPDEVRHSLSRIESEAIRMTSLVEDLLLLARLDSRRELERREVDLSRVVLEAVGDAHAAGPDHHWVLDLPDEPVVAQGDEARLRQVVVNLLANARVHTPAGTTVTAGLATAPDGSVTIRIADDGPGIDPGVMSTLFERFSRGDASRQRATGTTGLGLSIVRGVVEAHDGTVRVESEPGSTVFTVTLPPAPAAAATDTASETAPATASR
ncbi:cell wall metabolism sensor histidine kinase WalK [Naasia sp. SYSU D00057]|uniref:sensor histidine kinase n=1 Tax=Naasia sp. SYSU D00057 TaxID=2817380 RepID=UPI001B303366|nr:HAMP domain-containing sensor histidine kinase [Naasia sp. SYSU D00057]